MIVFNPKLYTYHIYNKNYIIIEVLNNHQLVICKVRKLFWKFWVTASRPFPTWEAALELQN